MRTAIFATLLLLGCGKAVPKPPVLPPSLLDGTELNLGGDLPRNNTVIMRGKIAPSHDITQAAGGGGDAGKGVTIENFSGDGHMSKGLFNVDTGECIGCDPIPPSHEAAVYAELWKICKAKHLQYRVITSSPMTFALAWDGKSSYHQMAYDEIDSWRVWNFDQDPTAAAEALTKALGGPPTTRAVKPFDTGEVRP